MSSTCQKAFTLYNELEQVQSQLEERASLGEHCWWSITFSTMPVTNLRTATVAQDCNGLLPGQYAETVRLGHVEGQ